MVYNTLIFRVFGLYPLSDALRDTVFRKLDLFPSSGEGLETSTLLNPLERANLTALKYINLSFKGFIKNLDKPVVYTKFPYIQ
jgi:hypothetical protein